MPCLAVPRSPRVGRLPDVKCNSASFGAFGQADQDSYTAPIDLVRLWVHECERVFRDRIISVGEMEALDGMMADTAKKHLSEFQVNMAELGWLSAYTVLQHDVG